MRKRARQFTAISEVLGASSRRAGWQRELERHHVWTTWETIVGATIAAHASPARWRGRTLIIAATSHAWLQELTFMKRDLLEKIRAASPATLIDDLRFEVGTCDKLPPPAQQQTRATHPLSHDEEAFIDHVAQPIHDPEIRNAATRAMTKAFQKRSNQP